VDPQFTCPDPARSGREGSQQLRPAEAQLLRDDRGIGFDVERESLETDDAAGAGGRRDALGDERFERRDGACRIAQRIAVTEWSRVDHEDSWWPVPDGMLQGRRDRTDPVYAP